MLVYKCVITGDEMFSDSYEVKEMGALYEVKAKFVTQKADDIDESKIGGNKSAEEPDESATDETTKSGINVAMANRYSETGFGTKKEFIASMKAYFKAIQDCCVEKEGDTFDVKCFQAEVQDAFKNTILPMYKDLQFFTGESTNPDGTMPMLLWRKEGEDTEEIPYFYFFKKGLCCEKY